MEEKAEMIKFVLFILYTAGLFLIFLQQMFEPAQLGDQAIILLSNRIREKAGVL